MNRRIIATVALVLAYPLITAAGGGGGCATTSEPEVKIVTVQVPVAAPCEDKRGPKPAYVDTLDAIQSLATQPDKLVALLLGGRGQRIARETESDGQIAACAKPPNPG